MLTSCHCQHEEVTELLSSLQVGNVVCSDGNILSMDKFKRKHSDKYIFYTLRFDCSFAAANTIKPQLL